MTLSGDTTQIRVWSGGSPVLGAGGGSTITIPASEASTVKVEFGEYFANGSITIERLVGGDVADTANVEVWASPLLMNHHLQPAEYFFVVQVGGNTAMINAFSAAFGNRFQAAPGGSYQGDVWIQDELEFGYVKGETAGRQDLIIDSIRDRGLDDFPEDIQDDIFIVDTWGIPSNKTTFDSFGNLECSPPVTVGDTEYPFGRIYFGHNGGSNGLDDGLRNFLHSQEVQAPVEIDTDWLIVGHVDEFSTFIPDPSSPKGFKLLFADVTLGYELLDSLDPATSLGTKYANTHGFSTVGQLQNDDELRMVNEEVQDDRLTPILAQMKAEFGLTDADVILIPSIFEKSSNSSRVVALVPGQVNLVVGNVAGETPKLMVPDAFFRPGGAAVGTDPYNNAFTAAMPDGYDIVYVDNWSTYHANLGEVHCGTNVIRTPPAENWWEVATHLVSGN
jgi:hypothetical protein